MPKHVRCRPLAEGMTHGAKPQMRRGSGATAGYACICLVPTTGTHSFTVRRENHARIQVSIKYIPSLAMSKYSDWLTLSEPFIPLCNDLSVS